MSRARFDIRKSIREIAAEACADNNNKRLNSTIFDNDSRGRATFKIRRADDEVRPIKIFYFLARTGKYSERIFLLPYYYPKIDFVTR